ncbi:MAG: phosphoglycolate phosphatase [Pseudomonadota bacterium]
MKTPSALLFDLDGTLVDSAPDIAAALNAALSDQSLDTVSLDQARQWIGGGAPALVSRALAAQQPRATDENARYFLQTLLTHYRHENGRHGAPYPGVVQTLAVIAERGIPMACVTNKPEQLARDLLVQYDMPITQVTGGDTLSVKKPNPAPIVHTAKQLAVDATACWMVGDSAADAGAARHAGSAFIWVDYGYHQDDNAETLAPDAVLSDFKGLLALLDSAK